MFDLKFADLPPITRAAILGTLILMFVGGLYYLLFKPEIEKIEEYKARIKEKDRALKEIRGLREGFQFPDAKERNAWKQLEELMSKKVPEGEHLLSLVRDLAETAHNAGIEDISFSMLTSSERGGLQSETIKTPTSIKDPFLPGSTSTLYLKSSFHTGYKGVAIFLEGITDMDRLVEVQSMEIKRELPMIKVEITLKSYFRKKA